MEVVKGYDNLLVKDVSYHELPGVYRLYVNVAGSLYADTKTMDQLAKDIKAYNALFPNFTLEDTFISLVKGRDGVTVFEENLRVDGDEVSYRTLGPIKIKGVRSNLYSITSLNHVFDVDLVEEVK